MEVKTCTWPISTLLGGGDDGDSDWDVILELPKEVYNYILIEILAWLTQNGILW